MNFHDERDNLPPWTTSNSYKPGCWMRPPLPVRADGAGADLGVEMLIPLAEQVADRAAAL